jgi:hypothetical protein
MGLVHKCRCTSTIYLLDNGLNALKNTCDQIFICSSDPVDYTTANASRLGNENFGPGSAWASITAGPNNTRRLASTSVTDGAVTTTGNAAFWAAVDTINWRLLAAGSLGGYVSVSNGNVFNLGQIIKTVRCHRHT